MTIDELKEAISTDNLKIDFEHYKCGCGEKITSNGATSHSKKCIKTFSHRDKEIKKYFKKECILCNEQIPIHRQENIFLRDARRYHQNFCSNECFKKAKSELYALKNYSKTCPICKVGFVSSRSKFCSKECASKNSSINLSDLWIKTKKQRSKNIKDGRIKLFESGYISPEVWNKGLSRDEYLNHYIDVDGNNTLLNALKNNEKWFKKTSIEYKLEYIFKELEINYQYSFFCKNKQFDFILSFANFILILEADGDYWHKSIRKEKDISKRKIKRLEDKLKENVIYSSKFKKEVFLLRIWEYDINKFGSILFNFFKRLLHEDDLNEIRKNICKAKKRYSRFG